MDGKRWVEITGMLPQGDGYRALHLGMDKKRQYIHANLPELEEAEGRRILDIGAGTGFFCRCCQDLGHEALAILHPKATNAEGFRASCEFLGVTVRELAWGDRNNLLYITGSFDVVNSQGMIGMNDIEIWPRMLDEMVLYTKPGGLILLAANHIRATEHEDIIESWAKDADVELVFRKGTTWKWRRSG